jgi:AcrR family transcriptional regulator
MPTAPEGPAEPAAKPRKARRIRGLDAGERRAERRRLLLDAGLELFGTRGYSGTSIEQICQTAGVGTYSFYEVFSSKEDVIVALYERIFRGIEQDLVAAFEKTVEEPDQISILLGLFVHGIVDDPLVARVAFIEVGGISARMEEHRWQNRNRLAEFIRTVARSTAPRYLPAGKAPKKPAFRDREPNVRRNNLAIAGAIVELIRDWLLDPDPGSVDDLVFDIVDFCERSLRAALAEHPDLMI